MANSSALSAGGLRISSRRGAGRASIICYGLGEGTGVRNGIVLPGIRIFSGSSIRSTGSSSGGSGSVRQAGSASKNQKEASHQHAQLKEETSARHLYGRDRSSLQNAYKYGAYNYGNAIPSCMHLRDRFAATTHRNMLS
jgi:hypothetical protein